ncbi:MAG TPA: hypothetical protein PKG54_12310 [Phycisphaerae bacterium]|jgi:putative transposase|nr:hypothetical protein [Phycisphaerae bacterium]HOJ53269.1 hypothetical protein [Phycisphaerae bacterium]HOL25233.1 hypothetical protein [Phycisphaerae bacterium]HPP20213.1 hypothetical protein [Phycisphaerae bacterium]HPU32270.1 hypothetical protein [Phycisphaerae bacterium]
MPLYLKRHDEPGHVHFWTISCYRRLTFFWYDPLKQVVVDGLRLLQRKFDVCLIAYVIMPEHLHVMLLPHRRGCGTPTPIWRLLHAFKTHVGFHGKAVLRDCWRKHGRLWSAPLMNWALDPESKKLILYGRGYDFNITEIDTLLEKLNYCHHNPVKRGLVDHPKDWAWSSYRFYEHDDRSVLAMDWDGRWPIVW